MRHAYSRPVSEELVSQTIELPRGELRLLQPEESPGLPDDGRVGAGRSVLVRSH